MEFKHSWAGILATVTRTSGPPHRATAKYESGLKSKMACQKIPLMPLVVAVFVVTGSARAAGPSPVPPEPTPGTRPNIAPQAVQLLQRACDELANANALTFHANVMFDEVLPSGVKLQFAGALDYAVKRPNELAVDYRSDLGGKRLWFDGKTVTLVDVPYNMYASVSAPGSIDQMMDHMTEAYHVSLPLGDMASGKACEKIDKQVNFGAWVGVNDVFGEPCDHIAFAANSADYQVWLQHTGKPLPRKVVINYRALRGSPAYIAFISDWKFPGVIAQGRFRPSLPQGAVRIDFAEAKEQKP